MVVVPLNPPGQYADDRNLRARQRFWQHQSPYFDIVGWVLELARLSPGMRVLDAGCGNGEYLRALAATRRAWNSSISHGNRRDGVRAPPTSARHDRRRTRAQSHAAIGKFMA